MNKFLLILLAGFLVFSTLIKLQVVKNYNFPFTMDQGRDLVDIRQMVVSHTPRLVGPTTSINGVLLGPFWYYFLLPPFVLSGGNPQAIMNWQILWFQLSAIILWFVLKKKDYLLAFIVTVLYLLMPVGFNTGRYFWNANAMPIFTGIYLATILWAQNKLNLKRLFILGFVSGLSMQIEAAFGVIFFPFAFLFFLLNKRSFKELVALTVGFFVTLLPQIFFELRHGFIMTKVLISEFAGKGEMLGEKMLFGERISQRYSQLLGLINFSSHLHPSWVRGLFALGLILIILTFLNKNIQPKLKIINKTVISFFVFAIIFYLAFPQTLKPWYLLGLCVFIIFIVSIAIYSMVVSKNTIISTLGIFFFVTTCFYACKSQLDYLNVVVPQPTNDRSNLRNELADIDWVYSQAKGEGFKAYSYLPSVYDFPYHYLYWWYGTKKYGYQPADVAYLPNMPEYIRDNNLIWTKTKPQGKNNLTFLIIEKDLDMPEREAAWLGNFSKLCTLNESGFFWTAKTKMLTSNCSK